MKLEMTTAKNSFKYGWLLSRIWPYIKPYWFRILLGFLVAIPLGLLDGVTAFALKPYMDYVIGDKIFAIDWHEINFTISSLQMSFILPIGVFVLCVAFVPVALIRKRIKSASNKNMVIGGNITTNINETYSGNKVMAAYELQDRQENYFRKQIWDSYDIGMSLLKRAGWMSPLMYLIASFGIATVLGVGTYLINSGQMTAGAFASFVTSLLLCSL